MKPIENSTPLPFSLVIFGGTGDLARRKLLPSLYRLKTLNMLPEQFSIIGFSTRQISDIEYQKFSKQAINDFSSYQPIDQKELEEFCSRIFFISSNFENSKGYQQLSEKLTAIDEENQTIHGKLFYLATPPSFFPIIINNLHTEKLSSDQPATPYEPRIVIEKPFGKDSESARKLNDLIFQGFSEKQVYRIDHYLGKETVQNILFFRFANGIYEPIWNRRYIDNIQITVAETIGVEDRGKYFEEAGILKDMVQNHILQLLSLVAMEPPVRMTAESIRNKKLELLQAIRPIDPHTLNQFIVRGQYGENEIKGKTVKQYRDEKNVSSDSSTETFVALKLFIDNWRWSEVPFYIRSGKRLRKYVTEVAIHFKQVPHCLFNKIQCGCPDSNTLVLKIQPDEGISFQFNVKRPGSTNYIETVTMDFSYQKSFKTELPQAYERLIYDFMVGDSTLFPHSKGIEASWDFVSNILEGWKMLPPPKFPNYEAGSWGPMGASELLAKDGIVWRHL